MTDSDKGAVVLTYDGHTATKDKRARWILPGHCVGVGLTGIAYAIVGFFVVGTREKDTLQTLVVGVALPLTGALLMLVPSLLVLGITMWLKQKIAKEVRFAKFRTAILWGVACGVFPFALPQFFQAGDYWVTFMLFASLVWWVVVSAMAGLNLCYRSHLRD